MPPLPTVTLGGFPGRLFMPLRANGLTEEMLAKMTYRDYDDGDIRVYCDMDVAETAPAGHQAGSVVAAVSCNLHAAPSQTFDFSTVAGCQNWWMRFSPILSVAAVADLPLTLSPYASATKLQKLSATQNHALGMVSWSAKMKVTRRVTSMQSADAARQRTQLKLQVKDDSGGRAFLLLQNEWATQCTGLQKDDTLVVSGAFLQPLECDDPDSLHPQHIKLDIVLDKATAPEARMAVIFPLGTSHPPTVVLSRATFGRTDMLPQAQPNGQRQPPPQPQQGFITAAQLANEPQAAKDRASGSGLAASGLSAAATATDGRSAKRQKVSQAQYTYVDLGSLPMHGQENVYGVISEFRMPRKTKGTDYLMNLTLIDPSSSDGSPPGVQVNVMLKPDRLHTCPSQLRIGRIIRLHRLRLQHFDGRAQGFVAGSSGVSYALAEADGDSTEPVEFGVINAASTAASNPQAAGTELKTPLDMSRVTALRAWNESVFFPQFAAIKQEYSAPISDIQTTKPFDLTCLVVGVVPSSRSMNSSTAAGNTTQELYVWDGTRAKVPTKRHSAVHAPDSGRYAACGSVMCVECAKAPMALRLAASRAQVGDIIQLKDCRLSDGTIATAWGPSARQGVCFKFRNTGRCDFGDRCRYAHDRNDDDGGGFDGPMSSLFTGAPGTGFNGSGGGGNGGGGGNSDGTVAAAAATGTRKSVWHIEFSDFSSFMVLPKQMRSVQEMTEQWSARIGVHEPPAAAPHGSAHNVGTALPGAASSAQQTGTDQAQRQEQFGIQSEDAPGETRAGGGPATGAEPNVSVVGEQGRRAGTGTSTVVPSQGQPSASARELTGDGGVPRPRLSYYLMVETQHTPHVQATSLRGILDHPTVPAVFRCVVRVADMLPRTDHGFISPFCEYCQRCSVSPQCVVPPPPAAPKPPQGQFAAAGRHAAPPPLVEPQAVAAAASTPVMICERCHGEMSEWTYWSVLKLVDDSASIGALLYRDAGEVFFDGVKASRLRHDRSRLTKLRTHLQTLLQPLRFSEGGRAQGTVYLANLCLKSYYAALPEGKQLAKGQKRQVFYQIFDSSITVNPANGQPEAKPLQHDVAEGAAIPQQ